MSRLPVAIPLPSFAKILRDKAVQNTASSFVALGWLSLLSMISIPIYIRLLGMSEWGMVAACVSLQLVSNFVDAGFSQIVPRWIAKEAQDHAKLRCYMRIFQRIYLGLGLLVFIGLQMSAGYLAESWFKIEPDRTDALEMAIRIISLQVLFQFLNNLHMGFWHGLQKQVLANIRACSFGTLKHAATMGALAIGPREAWLYATTFALAAIFEFTINAITVHQMLGKDITTAKAHHISIAPFLREVSTLSGGILLGLMVSHVDRIILSRTVSIEDFGIYTVALTLALAFLQLQTPFTRTYYPRIVQDIQTSGHASAVHLKRMGLGTVIFATFPAILACLFANNLLELWINQTRFIAIGTPTLQLLLLAVAANTLYNCIYIVIIASGESHLIIKFNLMMLAAVAIAAFLADSVTSIKTGGTIWLTATLTQLLLGLTWFCFRTRTTPRQHR